MQNTKLEAVTVEALSEVTGGLGGFLGMISSALGGGGGGGGGGGAPAPAGEGGGAAQGLGGGGGDITRGLLSSFGLGKAFGM